MKKLAIIGASYLQNPLILKAKAMGLETHVFAWAAGDVGEATADHFYPISIVEKEQILEQCRRIGIDGVCTIASDLAAITVNYVANGLGLCGNTMECTEKSTNKHAMRLAFEAGGDPSPKSILVHSAEELQAAALEYPVIVKPVDRSGSRGITKVECSEGLADAIENAKGQGFEKAALVEEFAVGQEYSVECISHQGQHHFLAMTKKFTTGAPGFVETGHIQPAPVQPEQLAAVKQVVFHALDTLGIRNSASHSELKISPAGTIRLIEIGGRRLHRQQPGGALHRRGLSAGGHPGGAGAGAGSYAATPRRGGGRPVCVRPGGCGRTGGAQSAAPGVSAGSGRAAGARGQSDRQRRPVRLLSDARGPGRAACPLSAQTGGRMKRSKFSTLFALHLMLMLYSMSEICSKKAAGESFLSVRFCLYYGTVILLLGVYAIGWQQVIKRIPLTTAFANKAVTVVWGLVWGALFFREAVTPGKLLGAALVIAGVILFERADGEAAESETDHG